MVDETNDIDIAFVGTSHMMHGIYTPYVQQKLDAQLGRKTVVRSICWVGAGFDGLYFVTKDLLAHRRVKTLVFYDECSGLHPEEVQQMVTRWHRFGDDGGTISALPFSEQAVYYFAAVIKTARDLPALLAPQLPWDPAGNSWEMVIAAEAETLLGCQPQRTTFNPKTGLSDTNFTSFTPQNGAAPADVQIYSPSTASNFVFSSQSQPFFQMYFARQFGLLVKKHGCQLVVLHLPVFSERTAPTMTESRNWSELLQTEVCLMGVPGRRLFAGLSETDIGRLYMDPVHLNENGQKYFTSLITPSLLQFYESHQPH